MERAFILLGAAGAALTLAFHLGRQTTPPLLGASLPRTVESSGTFWDGKAKATVLYNVMKANLDVRDFGVKCDDTWDAAQQEAADAALKYMASTGQPVAWCPPTP